MVGQLCRVARLCVASRVHATTLPFWAVSMHSCAIHSWWHLCAAHLCASFILFYFYLLIYLRVCTYCNYTSLRRHAIPHFYTAPLCGEVRVLSFIYLFIYLLFLYLSFFLHLKTWDRIRTCNVNLFTGDLTFLVNSEQSILLQTGTRSEWFHPPKGQLLDRCQPRLSGVFVPREWLCSRV